MKQIQKYQDTGWIQLHAICRYRVVNNILYLQIHNSKKVTLTKETNVLGVLPEKYRPTQEVILPVQFMGGVPESVNPLVHSRIETSGAVVILTIQETKYIEGFASYPLN